MPTPRPTHLPAPAPGLALALSLALAACGGSDAPTPECRTADDCPAPATLCVVPACTAGACGTAPVDAGAVLGTGTPGDCRRQTCDGHGAVVTVADDADAPASSACAARTCFGGTVQQAFSDPGAACAQDGGAVCDGAGACVQCLAAADCPGADGECGHRTCAAGLCGRADLPAGTALAAQAAGDCLEAVCDGLGGTTARPLDDDPPASAGGCSEFTCQGGQVFSSPRPPRAACSGPGGASLCDGAGACVACLAAADCPGSDGPCQQRTCALGACGLRPADAGTVVGDPVVGDCHQDVCDGAGAVITVIFDGDAASDGNQCTADVCQSGAPSHPPQTPGTACNQAGGAVCDGAGSCVGCLVGADCPSGVCGGNACQAPTCADTVQNGSETDVDCGGATGCPRCGTAGACVAPADCTSGVCLQLRCAAPSCSDFVRNGDETDVDCGGSCSGCATGRQCLAGVDCRSGRCLADRTCSGPYVTAVAPADGATSVVPGSAITVSFFTAPVLGSVTVQAAAGPCSGSVQVSNDDFATCLGIATLLAPFGSQAAVLQPALPLSHGATYKVRTTGAISAQSLGAFEPSSMSSGFTVADGGGCASALVLSQVYPGGGSAGATFNKDFVEVHNRAAAPVSLAGLSLQVTTASGFNWAVTSLAGTIPAGGYLLVQMGGVGAVGGPLPAPDLVGTVDLPATGAKVALLSTTVATAATCPTVAVLDLLGYGATTGTTPVPTNCFEGTAPGPAPADAGAALARAGSGCTDGNGSSADFASQLAVPRSAQSAALVCGCSGTAVNETGTTVEMDFCNVQSPASLEVASGAQAGPVWGRVFEAGLTEPFGAPPAITGQLGYGPVATDPRFATGWTFVPAAFNAQVGNDDEFQASFTAPAPGSYVYVYRFSPDGARWTYCDPNGAGSLPGLTFEPATLPALTVTP